MNCTDPADASFPLTGTRVLEVSSRVAGAYCGRLLADLGAEVARVPLGLTAYARAGVEVALATVLHQGKNVIPEEAPALRRIMQGCDVVIVDCLRTDAADGAISAIARDVVRLAGSGQLVIEMSDFGSCEPYSSWPGTALVTSAYAGMSWVLGAQGREPLTVPSDIPDYLAATQAAAAVVLALVMRDRGLSTRWCDVAMVDVLTYYMAMYGSNFIPYERPWRREGPRASESGGSYPTAIFKCSDAACVIMCRQDREWHAMLRAMGDPDWSRESRIRDPRVVARFHADEVDAYVRPWVESRTADEVFMLGQTFGFPVAPVRNVGETLADTQLLHRRFFKTLSTGLEREVKIPGVPWVVSERRRTSSSAPARRPLRGAGEVEAPLAGLRVLDFSWVWSGPMVTSALADLGAEVIKIEHTSHPDPARARGAAYRGGKPISGPELELSPYFNQLDHGKRSIEVDISTPGGAAVVRRLACECDIVVENMRPGVLARHGLGYDTLARENAGLVFLSMTTAGQSGPLSQMRGYAPVMSGLAGLEALVGYEDGVPMGLLNLALGDPNAAAHSLVVLLAAVRRQRETGRGCWIDISQMECMVKLLTEPLLESQLCADVVMPVNGHTSFTPHGHFRCRGSDAWLAVAVRTDAERTRLAAFLERAGDHSYDDLESALAAWVADYARDDAAEMLRGCGLAVSPVHQFEELQGSAWARDRCITTRHDHPYIGPQAIAGVPWRFGPVAPSARGAAPILGEDTVDVLMEIVGMNAAEIDDARRRSEIGTR